MRLVFSSRTKQGWWFHVEDKVLKENGREAQNWVSVAQVILFLKKVVGMENAEKFLHSGHQGSDGYVR